jgi:hypothetical protein
MTNGYGQSAFAGGVADKWGNRYEARWTIWRGVLPVLRGEFDALQVEPPDLAGEAAEFRLYSRASNGTDEVHQCKRQHATSWTVNALEAEGVLQPFGAHLASGTRVVFASSTPSVLRTLAEKAASPLSAEEWSANLNQNEQSARDDLIQIWSLDNHGVHDRLTRLTVHTMDEASLHFAVIEALAAAMDRDPDTALSLLGAFVVNHLMERLTARQVWDFLREKGFSPRTGSDPALSERVGELTNRYVRGVQQARPERLPLLPRAEVDRVVQALTAPDGPRTVAVIGPSGGGKSTVVASVCERLTGLGVVVGPMRLDVAAEAATAESLGRQEDIGFGGPPGRILGRAAAGEPAVLIVDQLDAVSALSGRGEPVLDGFRETLEQARAIPTVRVVVACRSHDLKYDRRLRRLLTAEPATGDNGGPESFAEVHIGDLSPEQVRQAVGLLGLPEEIPPPLVTLLGNAFNLSLLADVVSDASARGELADLDLRTFRTRMNLLAEYHRRVDRRLQPTLGLSQYTQAVFRIARQLGDSGQRSLTQNAVADIAGTVDVLLHEGVLAASGRRLRFFHEAYFDYVFALQHLQAGRTSSDLLQDDPQDVLRRGQVRAVLSLEREQDANTYVVDLRGVLDRRAVRSHLRAAVLAWLTDLRSLRDEELDPVLDTAVNREDRLRWEAVRTLSSEPFARALNDHGLLPVAAQVIAGRRTAQAQGPAGSLAELNPSDCAYLLFEASRYLPEEASTACLPLAADATTAARWVPSLLRTVYLAGPTAAATTVALFRTLTETLSRRALETQTGQSAPAASTAPVSERDAASLEGAIRALFATDGLHALRNLTERVPALAVEAITAWLTAGATLAEARGARFAFDAAGPLPSQPSGLRIFETCATSAPVEFAQAVAPFLVEQLERSAIAGLRWRPASEPRDSGQGLRYDLIRPFGNDGHGLDDEIHDALRTALQLAAAEHPEETKPVVDRLVETDLFTAHQLTAAAYSRASQSLLDDALTWAAAPRVRGLPAGHIRGWAWGEVLAQAAATGSAEQRQTAIHLVLNPYANLDLDLVASGSDSAGTGRAPADRLERVEMAHSVAAEQRNVLSRIMRRLGDATPEPVRTRQAVLERLLGPAPDQPLSSVAVRVGGGPAPDGLSGDLTDDGWLDILRTHAEDRRADQDRDLAGGAPGVSLEQLEAASKEQPGRFARLVGRSGPAINPAAVAAIMRGLTSPTKALSSEDEGAALDAARTVFSWSPRLFDSQLCWLIRSLIDRALPDDVLAMIASIARTAANPPREAWQQADGDIVAAGMNGDRGRAVITIADLLSPAATRAHRTRMLVPALEAVLDDPAEQVRAMLPPAIVRTYLADKDAAGHLAERWLDRATDEGLHAPELERLAWQLTLTRPSQGVRLIRRMLISVHADVRTRAGQLAALISLRQPDSLSDGGTATGESLLHTALQNTAARKGVAALLAELVDELSENPSQADGAARPVRPDKHLLIALLDDTDSEVRSAALRFADNLAQPLDQYRDLLAATGASQAFREHPGAVLHALSEQAGDLPTEALDLCERWFADNTETISDIRTAAAGDAYSVTDIVLSIHVRTAVGSAERTRCLDLLDRLIEAGAAEANKKADDAAYAEDL